MARFGSSCTLFFCRLQLVGILPQISSRQRSKDMYFADYLAEHGP